MPDSNHELPAAATEDPLAGERSAQTPARILAGRAGPAYRTATWLELRRDHAAALDAVHEEFDLDRDLPAALIERAETVHGADARPQQAGIPAAARPGPAARRMRPASSSRAAASPGADIQFVIGDGLSTAAVRARCPSCCRYSTGAAARGWKFGQPFAVKHCRVGVLNDVGELLDPAVVVLLIGERPGLATAESLSAYLAYRPRPGHTDAHRNLISNIHARGIPCPAAAERILDLAQLLMHRQTSGVAIKEPPRQKLLE